MTVEPSLRTVRPLIHRIERATRAALGATAPVHLLVALSGGADSSAALIALAERSPRQRRQLAAAYFDHGLAPVPVRAEFRQAVEALTNRLDVPLHTGAGDVRALAGERRLGLEEAAREARYTFLADVAKAIGADAVVTGHTRDDQAETVLLHLLRGAGIDGLAAMRPRSPLPIPNPAEAPSLIRPLLWVARAETLALCAAYGVAPVHDPANWDRTLARNRVRHELLPLLREWNPQIDEALARLAATAAVDSDALTTLARRAADALRVAPAVGPVEAVEAGTICLSRQALRAYPPAVQARLLRLLAQEAGAPVLSHERTEALQRLADRGGHALELGAGVCARALGDRLLMERSEAGL